MFEFGGSPTHVLKRDPSKLETRSDVCLFVGYLKGTKGYIFYDPQDQKVFVSTNARFKEVWAAGFPDVESY